MPAPNVATKASSTTEPADATHVVTLPASIAAGDLLLLMTCCQTTFATPAGWTKIAGPLDCPPSGGNGVYGYVFGRIADGSEGASVTLTAGANAYTSSSVVYRYDGSAIAFDLSAGVAYSFAARGATSDPNAPALTLPSSAERSWVAVAFSHGPYLAETYPLANDQATEDTGPGPTFRTSIAACTVDADDDAQDPGAFHWLYGGPQNSGAITIAVSETTRTFRPLFFGTEVGFAADIAFAPTGPVLLLPHRFGTEVGFTPGLLLTVGGARQVMLTGGGIETPEMTVGGSEGQVLVRHDHVPPSWEDASAPTIDWAEADDLAAEAFGDAAAAGDSIEVPRANHRHAMPANPVTGHEAAADPHTGYVLESLLDTAGDIIVASAANTPGLLAVGADGTALTAASGEALGVKWARRTVALSVVFQTPVANDDIDVFIPFACTVVAWTLVANASGAIVIDVWNDSLGNYPPTDADAMPGAGQEPTIAASGTNAQDTDLSNWGDVLIAAGSTLRFHVDSVTAITRCTLTLTLEV